MKRLLLTALAIVVALVFVSAALTWFNIAPGLHLRIFLSEDEPPIIVKNGTMEMGPDAASKWDWKGQDADPGDGKFRAFSLEPGSLNLGLADVGIWVNVAAPGNPCSGAQMPFHATTVHVSYTATDVTKNYQATFQRQRRVVSFRVNVRPGKDLTPQTGGPLLTYDQAGYISELLASGKGGQLRCEFAAKEELTAARLCATEAKCK